MWQTKKFKMSAQEVIQWIEDKKPDILHVKESGDYGSTTSFWVVKLNGQNSVGFALLNAIETAIEKDQIDQIKP